jgi:pimeloyl-ACP methyl ester carboxylesterase
VKALLWLLAIFLLLYLALCVGLALFQRSLIYFPQAGSDLQDPADTLRLEVPGASLAVSVRPHDGPRALLYFGGNAEDVAQSLPAFSQEFPDRALYLMHYRGYGGSSGKPTEEALQSDAEALFDLVHKTHREIAVLGRSLGSGVAIRLASRRPVARLVLVTPYDSLEELAAGQFPYVPVSWILRDKFESWRYAPAIRVPTLILMAEQDEVIPPASTRRLAARFNPGVAYLKVIPGVGHNSISGSPRYFEYLRGGL